MSVEPHSPQRRDMFTADVVVVYQYAICLQSGQLEVNGTDVAQNVGIPCENNIKLIDDKFSRINIKYF